MPGRHERHGLYGVVMALLVGCSEAAPEVPARDGGDGLDGSETSAETDVGHASDVVDAAVSTDRDGGAEGTDGMVQIDARADTDVSDASTAINDATSDVVDAGAPTDGGGDVATTDVAASSAEFLAIYEGILRPRCATSGCHVVGSSVTRLAMSDASSAYANLVNRRDECSSYTGTRIRVVPFDPSTSAVMLFDRDGLCGRRHNAILPSTYGGAARDADATSLRAWIMAGAR